MPAIVVMSKLPIPGKTKTRLIGKMSPEECAAFHLACLKDTAKLVQEIKLPSYLYLTGGNSLDLLTGKGLPENDLLEYGLSAEELDQFTICRQTGIDLGERMSNVFRDLLKKHERVLVIGADIPGILPEEIIEGVKYLDKVDVLLGPAEDGGYYLIGMSNYYPELFTDIPWGTEKVLAKTLAQVKGSGLSASCLPFKTDIDTWDDFATYYRRSLQNLGRKSDEHVTKFMKRMINKISHQQDREEMTT